MGTVTETKTSDTVVPPVVVTRPVQQVTVVPKSLQDRSDQRKDWALWILAGGGMAMTAYAAVALWLVNTDLKYVYWLGMASMVQIMILFTGIAGLLVKRNLNISRSGIIVEDHDRDQP